LNSTAGKETPAERDARMALGFRPKKVTPEMVSCSTPWNGVADIDGMILEKVETVSNMFPDMPK
jgi:hypothetical protein